MGDSLPDRHQSGGESHQQQGCVQPASGVLVTRPEPGLSETVTALLDAGWQPFASPALVVRPYYLPELPAGVSAVVLTSGQAVPCASTSVDHSVPVFAVGDRTARRAHAAGFSVVYSAQGDASALSDLLVQQRRPEQGALLLLSGSGQGELFAHDLRAKGFTVFRRVAYSTRPVKKIGPTIQQALEEGRIGYSLFFSAESAKGWLSALPRPVWPAAASTIGVVMSDATKEVLFKAGWRTVRVAPEPNAASLLSLLGSSP